MVDSVFEKFISKREVVKKDIISAKKDFDSDFEKYINNC